MTGSDGIRADDAYSVVKTVGVRPLDLELEDVHAWVDVIEAASVGLQPITMCLLDQICSICERTVLRLEGQYEYLSPFIDNADEDREAFELVGEIHTMCLVESLHGLRWTDWRVKHLRIGGYQVLGTVDGWTVLATSRDRYALHESGASIHLAPGTKLARPREGIARASLKSDAHVSLDDRVYVADAQARLLEDGFVPLAEWVDQLEIRDRLYWPDVLTKGKCVFTRPLRRDWSPTEVSAEIHYEVGVPQAIAEMWSVHGVRSGKAS